MGKRYFEIENIGPVLFQKSRRAKRVTITVKPLCGVRVTVPYEFSYLVAERFVREKTDWIKKALAENRLKENRIRDFKAKYGDYDLKTAGKSLRKRVEQLSDIHGLRFNRLFFRQQKTRWGSCSYKNNINLNLKLNFLPPHLRDYVIIHELLHVKYKTHSRMFNHELSVLTGDLKKLNKELRDFQYILY